MAKSTSPSELRFLSSFFLLAAALVAAFATITTGGAFGAIAALGLSASQSFAFIAGFFALLGTGLSIWRTSTEMKQKPYPPEKNWAWNIASAFAGGIGAIILISLVFFALPSATVLIVMFIATIFTGLATISEGISAGTTEETQAPPRQLPDAREGEGAVAGAGAVAVAGAVAGASMGGGGAGGEQLNKRKFPDGSIVETVSFPNKPEKNYIRTTKTLEDESKHEKHCRTEDPNTIFYLKITDKDGNTTENTYDEKEHYCFERTKGKNDLNPTERVIAMGKEQFVENSNKKWDKQATASNSPRQKH